MSTSLENAIEFLRQSQQRDGGWGYGVSAPSMTEPTAAVVLALRAQDDMRAAREQGLALLKASQHADGGWGLSPEDPLSQWHTSWGTAALASLVPGDAALPKALDWLRASAGIVITDPKQRKEIEALLAIDPAIRGWPWGPKQAAWVEPTSLTLMALHLAKEAPDSERVKEGILYLLDRRCEAGGWNIGSPAMFDSALEPRAHPTAWALVALRPHLPADHADIKDGLVALRRQMAGERGSMTAAWGILALRTWGVLTPEEGAALEALQRPDGSWDGNPYVTATAILALGVGWPLEQP